MLTCELMYMITPVSLLIYHIKCMCPIDQISEPIYDVVSSKSPTYCSISTINKYIKHVPY